ncbi:baseplate J/gp47 family protein [Fusobacterium necrophorum]|uniref:baseplate assembly protein n=1 Tax=Fusobacterium TaxID=848 RepID=UPI0001BC66EB|nr:MULTISPECIES: baseplate J/gp47 family protein [Fusobacterium]AVQ16370.1 baseplate J protein [Fusobacterium gonidiaformans ATCC 25563]EFS28944.1 hypothetical protein FGAG_01265 [Fusobacterium gonidiaformans ATCC 25563]MDK4483534.1 baseplate J/gp47 family protein [Fusobacterium necrophorum]MDK4499955.1 baseplate J/gp47 family protein [Fusobacterium necrophorum]MDK4507961.1 baseplate J/gp47 family protein [Fusobacterium necrophorum]
MNDFNFIELDTNEIKQQSKKAYEEIMKVKIQEGDPAEDFIDWVVYILSTTKNYVNFVGKMNLLRYSSGKYLDALGELMDVERIQERSSECLVEYTFSKIFDEEIIIPKGHKVSKGNLYFESIEQIRLEIGRRKVTGKVRCLQSGVVGNEVEIGEINTIIDDIPYLLSVSNITKSTGGAIREGDNSYRDRIRLKPKAFSVAGPYGAYQYHTITAHQDIIDTHIYTPQDTPGVVKVIPLLSLGKIPSKEILEIVRTRLDDESIRPLTDKVEVEAPKQHSYDIIGKYWIKKGEDVIFIKNKIEIALQEYIDWQKAKLGRDINPNKLIQLLIMAGAKRVELSDFTFVKLERNTVAKENTVNLKYQGEEDE